MLKRVLIYGLATLAVSIIAAAVWIGPSAYRMLREPVYETAAPVLPDGIRSPAVLVFSKTNGFRDDDAIAAANDALAAIARRRRWGMFQTESGAVFNPGQLARFRTVVWNNVSGDVLTVAQRAALRAFIERGGGFVALHGSGGDPSYRWRWYVDRLIGAQFVGHTMWPQRQQARIRVEDRAHPAMAGLPAMWTRTDEWYSFDRSVRNKGYRILATLDESSYRPRGFLFDDLRMGADHPIVWSHCEGAGRVFYSALGHSAATYAEPLHRRMIADAIGWSGSAGPCADGR